MLHIIEDLNENTTYMGTLQSGDKVLIKRMSARCPMRISYTDTKGQTQSVHPRTRGENTTNACKQANRATTCATLTSPFRQREA